MSRMTFDWAEIVKEVLQRDYPKAKIVVASPDEVIAELGDGEAVVAISTSGSRRHFHLKTKETYEVLEGVLAVDVSGRGRVLKEGDVLVISPPDIHKAAAVGHPTTFRVRSDPPWSCEDHFEV